MGSQPVMARTMPPTTSAATTGTSAWPARRAALIASEPLARWRAVGSATATASGSVVTGPLTSGHLPRRHEPTHVREVAHRSLDLAGHPPAREHHDPIAQCRELVELLGDQQHAGALLAQREE